MITNRREFLKASCLALGVGLVAPAMALSVINPQNPQDNNDQGQKWDDVVYTSAITCPKCGTRHPLTMPSEHALRVFLCSVCLTWLAPKQGDHCLFESYGTGPCAATQIKKRRAAGLPVWVFQDNQGQNNNNQ